MSNFTAVCTKMKSIISGLKLKFTVCEEQRGFEISLPSLIWGKTRTTTSMAKYPFELTQLIAYLKNFPASERKRRSASLSSS